VCIKCTHARYYRKDMCIKCTHAPRAAVAAWIEARVVVTQLRATVAALSLLPPPSDCIRDADRGSSGGDSTPSYDGCYGRRLGSAGSRYFFLFMEMTPSVGQNRRRKICIFHRHRWKIRIFHRLLFVSQKS
jgi:hypothetical protein